MYFDQESLVAGLVIGAVVTASFGWLLSKIDKHNRGRSLGDKLMAVYTDGTSRSVMHKAAVAARMCFVWVISMAAFVAVAGAFLYWLIVSASR